MTCITDPDAPLADDVRRRLEQHDDAARQTLATLAGTTALTGDDAELLTSWAGYVAAVNAISPADADRDYDKAWRHADKFANAVTDLPVHTLQGVAAKLRLILLNRCSFPGYHEAILRNAPSVDDDLEDGNDRMLWQAIQVVDQLAGAVLPAAAVAQSGDDAALVRAFADWVQAIRDLEAFDPDCKMTNADHEPYMLRMDDAQDRIVALPANTPHGAALKVRWAWSKLTENRTAQDTIVYGRPVDPDDVADWRLEILWNLIPDLERMALVAPTPAPVQPDTFADAVADISASAEPDMVSTITLRAGAKAAGVTVQQARTVWQTMAAMVAGPAGVAA